VLNWHFNLTKTFHWQALLQFNTIR